MFHNDVQTESQSDLKSSQLWEKWKATVPRAKGYGGTGQATFLHPTNIQISFLNLICSQFLSITAKSVSKHNTDAEDCFKFLFLTFVQEDWAF